MKKISDLYYMITSNEHKRMESYYFLVAFYGAGFPSYLRSRKFISRGKKLEMWQNFKERILNSYYDAKFIESVDDCPELKDAKGRFIQVEH